MRDDDQKYRLEDPFCCLPLLTIMSPPDAARADQGGIGFWLPGAFGSLAATPLTPGWSWAGIYLHSSVDAGGGVAASRAINFPNRTVDLNINLRADLDADVDLGVLSPTYVFQTPVLGGQFAVTLLGIYGRQEAAIDATVTGSLGPIGFAASAASPSLSMHSVTSSCSRRCAGTRACTTTWSTAWQTFRSALTTPRVL